MTELKTFYETEELPNKFVAIFDDGSGAVLFEKNNEGLYHDVSDYEYAGDLDWFTDAGYLWFIPLPDDFKVWGE